MQPRFGPVDDPLRNQAEDEIAQLIAQLYNEVDNPREMVFAGRFHPLPQSQNIDDRRNVPMNAALPNAQEHAYPPPNPYGEDTPEEWEGRGVGVPTKRDLDTLYKYMPDDMNSSNNLLYDFFKTFPKYTRALMIHEGQNPTDSPDKYAITPGEWEAMNRYRSMQIDPYTDDPWVPDDDEDMAAAEAVNPDR